MDIFDDLLENILGIISFSMAIIFITVLSLSIKATDRATAREIKEKQSIVQTQDNIRNKKTGTPAGTWEKEHINIEHTLTGEEIFMSILYGGQLDKETIYKVNNVTVYQYDAATGSYYGFCNLPAAREGDEGEISKLKARCTGSRYKMEETYKHDGDRDYLAEINFIPA